VIAASASAAQPPRPEEEPARASGTLNDTMKHKRDREEACHICGHYHDVSTASRLRPRALGRAGRAAL
jgi:hypothetical protein